VPPADYNQLELRVLAHLTECRSLIAAFQSGADIHSETALDMYPAPPTAPPLFDPVVGRTGRPDGPQES